jgi:TonB family protein
MPKLRKLCLLSLTATFWTCQTAKVVLQERCTSADYREAPTTGDATISGQAFLTTQGGDVKRGAGRTVYLDPVTRCSWEYYENVIRAGSEMEGDVDPFMQAARRTTTADADGRFHFDHLSPGSYYVAVSVTWLTRSGTTGGTVSQRVKVLPHESKEIVVSRLHRGGPRRPYPFGDLPVAPPAQASSQSGCSDPVPLSTPKPTYPSDIRKRRIEGYVVIRAIVTTAGTLGNISIIKTSHPDLTAVAVSAVAEWRYQPGTCGGKAVPVVVTHTLTFTLDD